MLAILVFTDSVLLTLEINTELLMPLENSANLFILLESLKKKEVLYAFMKKRSMDLMMMILWPSDKSREWVRSMENNSRSRSNLLTASLLETQENSAPMLKEELQQKSRYLLKSHHMISKKVWGILILLTPRKCQSQVGINSEFLNNFTLFWTECIYFGVKTNVFLIHWARKIQINSRHASNNIKLTGWKSKEKISKSMKLMKS